VGRGGGGGLIGTVARASVAADEGDAARG
jgi:hypothetical protein